MNIPTSFTLPSKASLAITESFAAESAAAAAVIKNHDSSTSQTTSNKTVTRQRKKKTVMSRSETPIVSMDDIYTKLDKLAINNSFLRRSGSSSCGSISSTGSINDPNNDEFYMNLYGNMSDDSMEIGSVDSDDIFIEETEKTSSSFFYNPTGAPVKSNRKPRRRGKKQSKTISEFCKNQQQPTLTPTTTVEVVVGSPETTVPTLVESPTSSATSMNSSALSLTDVVTIAPVRLPPRSILRTSSTTKRNRLLDADGQRPTVQFCMDESGTTVVPDILSIQPISYEYYSDVYYTDAEFERTKTQAYYCVEDFLIDNEREMMCLSQLINEAFCGSASMSTTGWSRHIQQESIRQLYDRWSSSCGRGLEAFLIPTLYNHNKDCINTILSYQQKLKQHRSSSQQQQQVQQSSNTPATKNRSRSVPMYDKQYLLAQEAVRQTEGSTKLAQLTALGDQHIVELYRKQDAHEEERKKKEAMLKVAVATSKLNTGTRTPGSPKSPSNILTATTSWFTNRFGH